MKIALNVVTTGIEKPLEKDIQFAGKHGYDGVEIDTRKLETYLKDHSMADLKKLLKENKLEVAALMAFPFIPFGEKKKESLASIAKWAPVAKELGAPGLLTYIWFEPPKELSEEQKFKEAGKAAAEYAEIAGKSGVKIILEPCGGAPFANNPKDVLRVIKEAGNPPNLGLMMDTFHYFKSNVSMTDKKAIPLNMLKLIHVNDCDDLPREKLNDSNRLYPGKGIIPLVEDFKMLKEKGYEGYLSIEIFRQEYYDADQETVVKNAIEALKEVLKKV